MAYELPPLPYDYTALEPTIDEATMRLHHDKHHQAYVNNLNAAIEKHPDLGAHTPADLLKDLAAIPDDIRAAVRNNGGGHVNHTEFWETMTPGGATEPTGALAAAITAKFGSLDALKQQFNANGVARFGSGWTWLAQTASGELALLSTANQDSPLSEGHTPLLGNDVWEHAYYLKYNNRRPDYLAAWWNVVNWDVVGQRFQ